MLSSEALDKFLVDIQLQIDEADKNNKQKAADTLKTIADNYRQRISERLASELAQAEECRKTGDDRGARHHETLAEIYKSLFKLQG